MRIFILDGLVYIQMGDRKPVVIVSEENLLRSPYAALILLQDAINAEYAAHVGEAFRSALLGIPRDISPE